MVSSMAITAVETSVVALPFDMGGPHNRFAGQLWDHLEILLVKVETADGLVGWGEAFGHAAIASTKAAIDSIVAPLVLGRCSADINAITRSVLHSTHLLGRNGSFVFGFSGIEIALWDIAGKRAGQPLWRLLGGAQRDELPAYASLLSYTDPALVEKNVTAACKSGYRHIKLHELTREATLAAINAPGAENARIMLDVNCPWLPPVARDMARALIEWRDDPDVRIILIDHAEGRGFCVGGDVVDISQSVEGHDAAYKLSLLIRDAMGVAVAAEDIPKDSLMTVTAEAILAALAKGQVLKQISRARLLPDGKVEASVRIEPLPMAHPLAKVTNTENSVLITAADGSVHEVHGHGAGRWPTAAAVFADIMDLQRSAPCQRAAPTAGSGVVPLRMSA